MTYRDLKPFFPVDIRVGKSQVELREILLSACLASGFLLPGAGGGAGRVYSEEAVAKQPSTRRPANIRAGLVSPCAGRIYVPVF